MKADEDSDDLRAWTEGEWVDGSSALRHLRDAGASDPASALTELALTSNGQRPLLFVRARLLVTEFRNGTLPERKTDTPVFTWVWRGRGHLTSDWGAGQLRWEDDWNGPEGIRETAFGIEVRRDCLRPASIGQESDPLPGKPGPGREAGSGNYPTDPAHIAAIIADLDSRNASGREHVRAAIKARIGDIEPRHGEDESKIKRIRARLKKLRPDLLE